MERERRIEIWLAMSDQFLDTETRTRIPLTAWRCVDAGLSVMQARDVWCYEVTPAVWENLTDIAGDWCGFPIDWLVSTIEARRGDPANRSFAVYLDRVRTLHERWIAIARCMEVIAAVDPPQRRTLATDLTWLAEHYFDFGRQPRGFRDPALLRAHFAETFVPIFTPLGPAYPKEPLVACAARVEAAIAATGPTP